MNTYWKIKDENLRLESIIHIAVVGNPKFVSGRVRVPATKALKRAADIGVVVPVYRMLPNGGIGRF